LPFSKSSGNAGATRVPTLNIRWRLDDDQIVARSARRSPAFVPPMTAKVVQTCPKATSGSMR
jgi:hypothetical protein